MADRFDVPTAEDKASKEGLIGKRITIYWDGDQAFYPCKVVSYDEDRDKYQVLYENDPTGVTYEENLRQSVWKIWNKSDEEYMTMLQEQAGEGAGDELENADGTAAAGKGSAKKGKLPTYSQMVLDAVISLNERDGSSLKAIRKHILFQYDIKKQDASFNNLTLKAVNRAVASNELEKFKHSFKLSTAEKEKRKEAEKRALQALRKSLEPPKYTPSKENSRERESKDSSSHSRRLTPFVINSMSLSGVAAAHNKALRKELLDFRNKRDKFLKKRLHLLAPFLPEKDYFARRDAEDQEKKLERKTKKTVTIVQPKKEEVVTNLEMKFEEGGNASSSVNTDVAVTELNPEVAPVSSEDSKAPAEEVHEQSNMDVLLDEAQNLSMDQSALDQSVVMEPEVGEADISMAVDDAADDNEDQTGKASGEMEGELDPSSLDVKMEQQVKSEVEIISTKDKFAAIINAAEEEVDETKLYYSTLEGVVDLEKPSILKAELHDHQVTGISWMVHMFKNGMPMILGDQMGLGKTLQTIGFLAYLQATMNKKGPHLIVVPLSVLSNWISEIERFCPSFRAVRFHGPKQERERIKMEEMNDLSEFDIVVTTFEILVSEINFFRRKYVWTSVIIDEGHRLKNEKSQLSEKLRCVPCLGKIILTGTPLQNNLHELWALLYYLVPDIFTSSEPFDSGFDLVRGIIDNNVLRKARKMLSVFMLRRVKEQVNIKLPSKREITVLVSLTDQQIELYKQLLCGLDSSTIEIVMREGRDLPSSSSANALTNGNGDNASTAVVPLQRSTSSIPRDESTDSEWRRLMNILLQLRKICNHTYLLPHIAPEPYEVTEEIVTGSGKLLMLDRMLPKLKVDGHRVLIFSQFTSMLDILEDYCELRDYSFVRLDGETNRVKRRLDVRRFNSPNSNLFIFLISTRAGGLGLNLASADTVILYDSDWNPQVDLQAMERVHRIGQTKPVRIYRLVCRGSVEERMLSRAEKKLFLNAMVAEIDPDEELNEHDKPADPSEVMEALGIGGSAMSKSELASLIRFGANAVVDSETSGNKNISEEELDNLLERQGRDKVVEIITAEAVKNTDDSAVFEQAQAQLKERMESLKEVDLRQLGNMVYNKKKPDKKKSFGGEVLELNEKRQRKERIVMIDGKGTGYGGAVPVLASQLIEDDHNEEEVPENSYRPRGRKWEHRHFCTLCGKNDPTISNVVRCAHCPLVFHQTCGDAINIFPKGFGMFICPHHRCSDCNRSTSSAGGLLFRCAGCLTAFCEDCLPQDEIDSMGRCKPLETYGYHSKQAYYIKCPSCCNIEGFKPMGVLGDRDEREKQEADKKTAEPDQNDDGLTAEEQAEEKAALEEERKAAEEEAKAAMERTQAIRIVWEEVLPPPPPPPTPPKAKKTPKKRKNDEAAEVDGETNEEEATKPTPTPKKRKVEEAVESPPPPSFTHPKVPNGCTLNKGLTLIGTHLCLKELIVFSEKYLNGQSIDFDLEVASIVSKIDSGRYRSIQLFLNDVKYIIEMKVIKKLLVAVTSPDDKMSVNLQGKGLMQFLKDKLEPKLEL